MVPGSSFMSTSALTTAFFTQPVTWVWSGVCRLLSLWLIKKMCTYTNINKCTDDFILHKNTHASVDTYKTPERRGCTVHLWVFAREIHIQNIVWILFDIQSGCVKAAGVIGTRNQESIESKHQEHSAPYRICNLTNWHFSATNLRHSFWYSSFEKMPDKTRKESTWQQSRLHLLIKLVHEKAALGLCVFLVKSHIKGIVQHFEIHLFISFWELDEEFDTTLKCVCSIRSWNKEKVGLA